MTNRSCMLACLIFLLSCAFGATAHAAEGTVPDCVGLSLKKARGMLEQAGFTVTVKPAPGRTVGVVFSQEPGGLATRTTGSAVALMVGGPTPKPGITQPVVPMPDSRPEVDRPAAGSGAVSGPSDDLGAPPAGAGAVPSLPGSGARPVPARVRPLPDRPLPGRREPAGGASAAPGSTTLVYEGKAIAPGALPSEAGPEVPSVLNMSTRQAQRTLRRWNVKVEQTLSVPELVGKVVNQVPFASSRLATGDTITIIVAVAKAGPNQIFVPQAQGKAWHAAADGLKAAGLTPDPRSVPSSASNRGRVLVQSPQAGSLAGAGETVLLLVGRGPGAYSADIVGGRSAGDSDPRPEPGPSPEPKPEPTTPTVIDDGPPAGAGAPPTEPVTDTPTAGPSAADEPPAKPKAEPKPEPKPEPKLSAPSLKGPPAGESYPYKYGADFSWSPVTGATGYEFELQEEQRSGSWTRVGSVMVNTPTHRPAQVKRGRYRWRVRALLGKEPGRWSDFRRLYMY